MYHLHVYTPLWDMFTHERDLIAGSRTAAIKFEMTRN